MLALEEGLDVEKVLVMSLFHDMAETRTGDSHWIQKPYVKQDEDSAISDQLEGALNHEIISGGSDTPPVAIDPPITDSPDIDVNEESNNYFTVFYENDYELNEEESTPLLEEQRVGKIMLNDEVVKIVTHDEFEGYPYRWRNMLHIWCLLSHNVKVLG